MRINLPITQREYEFASTATLLSATDTRSYITYANAAFIEVSGFAPQDILNQPHNLVRHPDMPQEAFADMWTTLKAGKSWTALVKNRRANGDHYWVRANATPVVMDGALVGYMSVRTKPERAEVQAAEKLYADFREGRTGARRFRNGLIVRTGMMAWASALQTMSVRWRIRCGILGLAAAATAGAWACGLQGGALAAMAGWTLLSTAAASLWLKHQIARPLDHVLAQAQSVAAGQAAANVHLDRIDEIGMLMRSVNQAGLNLRSLVDDVSGQVQDVRHVSDEITQGNQELNARSEQATHQLQATASAMEEMTATISNSAEAARQATTLAAEATSAANHGGEVIGQVIGTMDGIATASRKISDIIGTIDGIAFQTNILALNAAVEAARAGEAGRGFAVVASEVRALAQRSASAAHEIKALITANMTQVEAGSTLVQRGGEAMTGIVTQVDRVARLIAEISTATQEQASGIQQVSQAVGQLDALTQQNAALAHQSAATADHLRERTQRLAEAVNVFALPQRRIAGAPAPSTAPPAAHPVALPKAPARRALPA